jgi:hypothetical protein
LDNKGKKENKETNEKMNAKNKEYLLEVSFTLHNTKKNPQNTFAGPIKLFAHTIMETSEMHYKILTCSFKC